METVPLITVVTPSIRPKMLKMILDCLQRQDFQAFQWVVISPDTTSWWEDFSPHLMRASGTTFHADFLWVKDPPKREGDFYRLCGAWNRGFQAAKGKLIVVIQDGIWFPPDMLSKFWAHYQANPKGLVTAVGHQYDQLDQFGKPINIVWQDPRARMDHGSFYEVPPSEMEMAVCSVPKQAVIDCGGIDEDYDKGAAVGEKEMCWRLDKLGYKFFIDQTIEYRAVHHPRLSKDWDEKYKIASEIFINHMRQLDAGQRLLNVGYVK